MIENQHITIVTYHYVRDLKNSRFPNLKGLDYALFKEQLLYLKKYYHCISIDDLLTHLDEGVALPPNSALLTFDDGYTDHFTYAFPLLDELNMKGAFFIPVQPIAEEKVLDVNKIHILLATVPDHLSLIRELKKLLKEYREDHQLESDEFYENKWAKPGRFDPPETIFLKRMLQVEFSFSLRHQILDRLFRKFISEKESIISRELYLNMDQIRCMHRHGMHFGMHGYHHFWFESLNYEDQEKEIDQSLDFIKTIEKDEKKLTICYPYGSYNADTTAILKKKNVRLGFTTRGLLTQVNRQQRLELPRLDTNDLPKDRYAPFPVLNSR